MSEQTSISIIDATMESSIAKLTFNSGTDSLAGAATISSVLEGGGPFNYVLTKQDLEKVDETATEFLAIDTTMEYSASVAGETVLTANLAGGRASSDALKVENYAVQYGGLTYTLRGEFQETGEVITLVTEDPKTGVVVSVESSGGVRSGSIRDADGNELGTIVEGSSGDLIITYSDGSTQVL